MKPTLPEPYTEQVETYSGIAVNKEVRTPLYTAEVVQRLIDEAYAAGMADAREWLPIESAPKDGTRILIHMPEASRQKVQEAYWARPWEGAIDEQCWWSTPHGPGGRGYTILPVAVKHWQPLPPPPTQRTEGGAS